MSRLRLLVTACIAQCALTMALSVPSTAYASTSPATSPATVSAAQVQAMRQASAEGTRFLQSVHLLTPYVVRAGDGTLSLQAPPDVTATIPTRHLEQLLAGLQTLNTKILAGEFQTNPSGQVFRPTDSNVLLTQDGFTGISYNWWGNSYCIDHADLNSAVYGVYTAAFIAVGLAVSPSVGATFALIAAAFEIFDKYGNGSCLNEPSVGPYFWTPQ